MTYQIPAGAYPKHWISPPGPPEEREVTVQLYGGMELHFEKSMDPYDQEEIRDAVNEVLSEIKRLSEKHGVVIELEFDDHSIEEWDVYPEHVAEEMEELP
jgi:hypothetical protein